MKRAWVVVLMFLVPMMNWAQCSLCRSQVENNVSGGGEDFARALNFGILYLFFTPYVALGIVALLWLRYSRIRNERKIGFS